MSAKLYIFEIENDPRKIAQKNLHEDDIEGSGSEAGVDDSEHTESENIESEHTESENTGDSENTIDDWDAYQEFLKYAPETMKTPLYSYKLISEPSELDYINYSLADVILFSSTTSLLETLDALDKELWEYKIARRDSHIFECHLEIIKDTIKDLNL